MTARHKTGIARMLKAIVDHTFVVPRIARKLASDPSFVSRVGLDAVPKPMRVVCLSPRVGFLISMYENAKLYFRELSHLTDEQILAELADRRLQGLPHIPDVHSYILLFIGKIMASNPNWPQLSRNDKFHIVCQALLVEEEKEVKRGLPEEFTRLTQLATIFDDLSTTFFDDLFEAVSKHRNLALGNSR